MLCAECGTLVYNAPKSETGKAPRSVRSRPTMKPSQRARILARDGDPCRRCGKRPPEVILHVDHLVSVEQLTSPDGDPVWIGHDWNLWTTCEECNLGRGADPLPVGLVVQAILANIRAEQRGAAGDGERGAA